MKDIFDDLYKRACRPEIQGLPGYKKPKKFFQYGSWKLVADMEGEGDGQRVKVYECRMPARFYKIEALPTPNSVGEMSAGFTLSTGSSEAKLVADIANAIREGMLGLA